MRSRSFSGIGGPSLSIAGMPPQSQTAFENVRFTSTPGTPWARLSLVPASSRPVAVNARTKRHDGMFLVDLFVPADTGTNAIEALANAVKDAFAPATRLILDGVAVQIDYAERSAVMSQQPDWLMCGVTIKWHSFSTRN